MNRYDTNSKNTSKFMSDLLNQYTQMPKGVFNESRRKIQDVTPYAIHPIECFPLFPNTDVYLRYDIQLLSKNPTIKRLLSGMNAELRVYKVNNNDCWEGWNNFITKGRSGKVSKSIPYVDLTLGSNDVTTSLPYNPAFSLNLQPAVFLADGGTGDVNKFTFTHNVGVQNISTLQPSGLVSESLNTIAKLKASSALRTSALPFVFYNKICKEYQSPNLLQDNPHWYPENENHDNILPYDATGAVTTSDFDNPTKAFVSGTSIIEPSAEKDNLGNYQSYPWLNVLQRSQRKGDMFNTGSPFPDLIRGDVPTLDIISDNSFKNLFMSDEELLSVSQTGEGLANQLVTYLVGAYSGGSPNSESFNPNNPLFGKLLFRFGRGKMAGNDYNKPNMSSEDYYSWQSTANNNIQTNKELVDSIAKRFSSSIQFSMAQWRYLATMTVMKERMALTDGSYNQLVKSMFGHNPNWHEHQVTFCGGDRQPIVFSEVVNTTESDNAPLGDIAGRAVSASGGNTIHVHSDDFGMFMTVLVITPDEYLSQGVDKHFSLLENAEQYFPILNNLSPDATKNKELFVSGNNEIDEDVFNYVERFSYLKSRRNQISGLLALPIVKIGDVGAWVINRLFGNTPQFNFNFNLGIPTDNEKAVWSATDMAEFNAVIGCSMTYIAPIPEDSRPSDMGISY